jgi:hypothetical protein
MKRKLRIVRSGLLPALRAGKPCATPYMLTHSDSSGTILFCRNGVMPIAAFPIVGVVNELLRNL